VVRKRVPAKERKQPKRFSVAVMPEIDEIEQVVAGDGTTVQPLEISALIWLTDVAASIARAIHRAELRNQSTDRRRLLERYEDDDPGLFLAKGSSVRVRWSASPNRVQWAVCS
jgi:hypothetical protein